MGVKSTVELTRESAEYRYIEDKIKLKERKHRARIYRNNPSSNENLETELYDYQEKKRVKYKAQAMGMTNEELENKLEEYNDRRANIGGWIYGGFDNYLITKTGNDYE